MTIFKYGLFLLMLFNMEGTSCHGLENQDVDSPGAEKIKVAVVDERDEILSQDLIELMQQVIVREPRYPISKVDFKEYFFDSLNGEDDFAIIERQIRGLLQEREAPHICCVVDVDGTLTTVRDPASLIVPGKVQPRPNALGFLSMLAENDVATIYSSAWHIFGHTCERLQSIKAPINWSVPLNTGGFYLDATAFSYVQRGPVCSVRPLIYDRVNPYYRHKALAPLMVNEKWKELEVLILVDDSVRNGKDFLSHLKIFNPYPNLKEVMIFCLTEPASPPVVFSTTPLDD